MKCNEELLLARGPSPHTLDFVIEYGHIRKLIREIIWGCVLPCSPPCGATTGVGHSRNL